MTEYPILFSPFRLNGITLKNRIVSAPTSLAELAPGGRLSTENIDYYKLRAAGGCAVVTVGDSIVESPTGRSHPLQIALDDPDSAPSLKMCADAIHSHGAHASIELDHGGVLCAERFIGQKPLGPSDMVLPWGPEVRGMTVAEIERIADAFGESASQAKLCGFDMVCVHMGHGWLLNQFLSPFTNLRDDEYGGSIENRMRFPLLALERIREAVGKRFPVEVRMSGSERLDIGYGLETGIEIAKLLDGQGICDVLHVSAGTNADDYSAVLMHPGSFQKEGENLFLAKEIRKHVKLPILSVGGFGSPSFMEETLASGDVDLIGVARALIADPMLPKKAFAGETEDIVPCVRCGECQSGMFVNRNIRCTVNPLIGRDREYFFPPTVRVRKKVLIAGGGPAGMQAAISARELGHDVVLAERSTRLGGALAHMDDIWFKQPLVKYRNYLIGKLGRLGVDVRLGLDASDYDVAHERPDAVVCAIGADPVRPDIAGLEQAHYSIGVPDSPDGLGKRVVIIGGGLVGSEYAVYLADLGREVTVLEMMEQIAPDAGFMHRTGLLHEIETRSGASAGSPGHIDIQTGMRCVAVDAQKVYAEDRQGDRSAFEADSLILAVGLSPRAAATEKLRELALSAGAAFYTVGDAGSPSTVMRAVRDGHDAAVDMGLR
jgi:2,4-dienoyl-CoA reductase-like NADH-dependent reductase (Old Yellow Enzyme family)/NADPH-dependent 2,4-dienoyl-CoA reductase/sulfur reductase-like enzyme